MELINWKQEYNKLLKETSAKRAHDAKLLELAKKLNRYMIQSKFKEKEGSPHGV